MNVKLHFCLILFNNKKYQPISELKEPAESIEEIFMFIWENRANEKIKSLLIDQKFYKNFMNNYKNWEVVLEK